MGRITAWCGRPLVLAALGVLFALLTPISARAEETPLSVPLSYVVNLSNWGPTTATGTAEVWRTDAEVRVHVLGLPVLTGQQYTCWLVNPQAGQYRPVGRFNVSSDGSAIMDVSLQGSIASGYTTILITVQPDPDTAKGTPSKLFSIAGFFPGNAAIQHQAKNLPDTGYYAQHPPFEPPSAYGGGVNAAQIAPPPLPQDHPWWTYAPLLVAACCFLFVFRRTQSARTQRLS